MNVRINLYLSILPFLSLLSLPYIVSCSDHLKKQNSQPGQSQTTSLNKRDSVALSILVKCETAYQQCGNFKDQGDEGSIMYLSDKNKSTQNIYSISKQGNVLVYKSKSSVNSIVTNVEYRLNRDNGMSILTLQNKIDTIPLQQVLFRIMQNGGGALMFYSSLLFPDIAITPSGNSSLTQGRNIYLASDTTINNDVCYSVISVSGYFPSLEAIHKADPKDISKSSDNLNSNNSTVANKYIIRKSDYFVIRHEGWLYFGVDLQNQTFRNFNPNCM